MTGRDLPPLLALHGWGLRTALGSTADELRQQLRQATLAARENPLFDASRYPCRLAAAIRVAPQPSRLRKFLPRLGLFAVEVAAEALAHGRQRLPALAALPSERLGLFFGYGGLRAPWDELMPAMQQQQTDLGDSWERGLRHLHPFFMLRQLSNNAQALAAEELTVRGDGATLAGANAGAQALAVAGAALSAGTIDAALCVAYDSLLAPEVLIELGLRRALTAAASREALIAPYAIGAAGAVPGEAAVALLLTRAEPLGPGGPPGLGYLRAVDGADAGSGAEQGPAATTLARLAAALLDRPVAVVDGAAQALAVADWAERQALHEAFLVDPEARLVATLAGCGQVGAAAPLLQAIALTLALRDGFLPAVAGLAGQPVADGPLRPLQQGFATVADRALALSAGPPGLAAALLIQLEDR